MMEFPRQRAFWVETAGAALIAVALFRFGLLVLVFVVPIQLVWIRRGDEGGVAASGLFLAALAATKLYDLVRLSRALSGGEFPTGLLFLDLAFPLGLLCGLFLLNSPKVVLPLTGGPREASVPERLFLAVGAGTLVYAPVFVWLSASGLGEALWNVQIELVRGLLREVQASDSEIRAYSEIVLGIVLSGIMLGYLMILVANWWLGIRIAFRSRFPLPAGNPVMARLAGHELTAFVLPAWTVWALIVSWAFVVGTMIVDLGVFRFVAWNAALVALAVYAFQGVAIVWHYLDRRAVPPGARIALVIGLVFGLLLPVVNVVVLIGLPGLGVSELWVNYHRFDESEGEE